MGKKIAGLRGYMHSTSCRIRRRILQDVVATTVIADFSSTVTRWRRHALAVRDVSIKENDTTDAVFWKIVGWLPAVLRMPQHSGSNEMGFEERRSTSSLSLLHLVNNELGLCYRAPKVPTVCALKTYYCSW